MVVSFPSWLSAQTSPSMAWMATSAVVPPTVGVPTTTKAVGMPPMKLVNRRKVKMKGRMMESIAFSGLWDIPENG